MPVSEDVLASIIAGLTAGTTAAAKTVAADIPVGGTVTVAGIEFTKISDNPFPDSPLAEAVLGQTRNAGPTPPAPWCRGCGERIEDGLVDSEDNSGLHHLCTEPVDNPATAAVPAGPPPSTITELRRVLIDFEAQRPRSMQRRLGPSELGTPCQQQIARKLAGAPRQPITEPTWAPFQGTAVHASMEDVVAYWNAQLGRTRWLAEDDLEADPGMEGVEKIAGHGDAFDTDWGMVVDWKYVGTTALEKLRTAKRMGKPAAEQVSAEYRVQGHIYGLGHERKGRRVKFVRLVLLARSWKYDDSDEWTEPYDPAIAHTAIARYYATHDLLAALDVTANPDFIAAVPATPGPDACKWCPFNRPGKPTDWGGCAGDTATYERRIDRFADGLIAR